LDLVTVDDGAAVPLVVDVLEDMKPGLGAE
jgi:hypothetical protein